MDRFTVRMVDGQLYTLEANSVDIFEGKIVIFKKDKDTVVASFRDWIGFWLDPPRKRES